jgi:hypothetical protein
MLVAQDKVTDLKKHITENSQEIWNKYLANFNNGVAGNIQIETFRKGKL